LSLRAGDAAPGESGEEELTRFFAETANEERSPVGKAPVKGSIMSFFKVTTSNQVSTDVQNQTKEPPGASSKILQRFCLKNPDHLTNMLVQVSETVKWSCEACTFVNAKVPTKSGWIACDICGTPHVGHTDSTVNDSVNTDKREIIVIDKSHPPPIKKSDCSCDTRYPESITSIVTPAKEKEQQCLLKFSVSKNSGRITIHNGETGERFPHNFDIDEVITTETSDQLLESEVNRLARGTIKIKFDDRGISTLMLPVIKQLKGIGKIKDRNGESSCHGEVKRFISDYLSLREVEKSVVKESCKLFSCLHLKQSVVKLMAGTLRPQSVERYSGGAKERALKNLQDGTASLQDHAILEGRACAWCAGNLSQAAGLHDVKSTYCSQKCAEQGRLQRGGMFSSTQVRAQVFGLEGGVCRKCGIDAHALYTRIWSLEPVERLNALINARWFLPKSGLALERLLQSPKEGDFWQADHIVPVSEGGGSCGLDNLQTLCTPCHQHETHRLRARLRLLGDSKKPGGSDGKRKQIDIRSAFLQSNKKVKE
jgi:HNH endonuclease